jgi:hypothetical protein
MTRASPTTGVLGKHAMIMKTLSDPELLMETKKRGGEASPVSGEELEAIAKEVITQPSEVIERLKAILGS